VRESFRAHLKALLAQAHSISPLVNFGSFAKSFLKKMKKKLGSSESLLQRVPVDFTMFSEH
jgi:hypothetical protein